MGCVTCECYSKQEACEKKYVGVSRVTEINGRYRHFKQKSSSIACRQFQEYITLDRASFTDLQ